MARVLIAVPTYESIYPDTFKALWDMDKGGNECLFEFVRGYDCAAARNNIADKSMELGCDYVLMVDNDVAPPRDALVNMLSHGADVVLGVYLHRDKGNSDTLKTCICKRGELNYSMQYTSDEAKELRDRSEALVRVHGGGMGCALIRTSVFRRIGFPYYQWVSYGNKERSVLSEDLFFCEKCKNEHIGIYADFRVLCGHMFRQLKEV